MEQKYNDIMKDFGYNTLVTDIFVNWEDVKDEILPQDRKTGSGNGTIHVFLGAADSALRNEFGDYYTAVSNGEDPSVSAIEIEHVFLPSNVLSTIGYVCQYYSQRGKSFENEICTIISELESYRNPNDLLVTSSYLKLSVGSSKLRPYFKQFKSDGVFTKLIRRILLPNSAYKISLYKNSEGKYAAFWLIGSSDLTNFEADSSSTKCQLDNNYPHKDTRLPLQQIFYGAPGTGKSFTIEENTNEDNRIRTTFHPDYDYATFVGVYKPTVKSVDRYGLFGKDTVAMMHDDDTPIKEDVIVYKFIPQAFIKAYVEAWRRYADAECEDKDFYLVIEEINRGNCAQIFGDLFQLLDRTNVGFSSYAVETESDMQHFLTTDEDYKLGIELTEDITNDNGRVIATAENVMNGKVLVLPPNLHIWATMNTSDQSLFPIDSAFKRRWDWKYVPIKHDNREWKVVLNGSEVCKWTDLQQTLNDLIYDATESEDKMLGDWFVKADSKNEINEEQLVGKIIFYLWNDVAKVDAGRLFDLEVDKHGKRRKVIFSDFYIVEGEVDTTVVGNWLRSIKAIKDEHQDDENQNEPEQ